MVFKGCILGLLALLGLSLCSSFLLGGAPKNIAVMIDTKASPDIACMVRELAKDQSFIPGNAKLQLFDYDGSLAGARDAAQNIAKQGFDVIVGPMSSHDVQATLPLFVDSGVPQVLPIASEPELSRKSKAIIRMLSMSDHYAELAAKYVMSELTPKKILVVANDSLPYSRFYSQIFHQILKKRGWVGSLEHFHYIDGELSQSALKARLKDFAPNLIYAPIYAKDLVKVYSEVVMSESERVIFTHAGLYAAKNELLKLYNPKARLIFNGLWDQQSKGENAATYFKIETQKCASERFLPNAMAVFDALTLVTKVYQKNPQASGQGFLDIAFKISFTGFLGLTKFAENNAPVRPLNLYELDNDKFKFVTSVKPEKD